MARPPLSRQIDLNTATNEELSTLPGIGADRAWDLIQHRPYRSWDDVRRIPGFTKDMVAVLQEAGATIGFERSSKL